MVEPHQDPEFHRSSADSSEKLLTDYDRISRGKKLRVAYLIITLLAFALSLATGDVFFILSSGFIFGAALLAAFILTRRERRLAVLISEVRRDPTHREDA